MAASEVYMNTGEVTQIGTTFGTISDVLQGVSQALEAMVQVLRAAAFVGLVGTLAEAQFLENMKKNFIDPLQKKCADLKKEILASVQAYEAGDLSGSQGFNF
jgi:hypothetical protein